MYPCYYTQAHEDVCKKFVSLQYICMIVFVCIFVGYSSSETKAYLKPLDRFNPIFLNEIGEQTFVREVLVRKCFNSHISLETKVTKNHHHQLLPPSQSCIGARLVVIRLSVHARIQTKGYADTVADTRTTASAPNTIYKYK